MHRGNGVGKESKRDKGQAKKEVERTKPCFHSYSRGIQELMINQPNAVLTENQTNPVIQAYE